MAVDDVIVDVHQQDGANDQTMFVCAGLNLNNLVQLAFDIYRGLGDPGRFDDLGRRVGQTGNLELVFPFGILRCGRVHRFGDGVDNNVDHEFAGLLDVPQGVFALVSNVS